MIVCSVMLNQKRVSYDEINWTIVLVVSWNKKFEFCYYVYYKMVLST